MSNNDNNKKIMSAIEIDAIGELMNISLGASATAASTMLDARVDITTPTVEITNSDEFNFSNLAPAVGVEITYVEGLSGSNVMLLKRNDVKIIVEMMMGMEIPDDEFELNEMNLSAICEIMNQMMGSSATALAELLSRTVNISTPVSFEFKEAEQIKEKYFKDQEYVAIIRFNLMISDRMESEFLNVMPIPLAKELVAGFFPDGIPEEIEEPAPAASAPAAPTPEPAAPAAAAPASAPAASTGGGDAVLDQASIERLMAEMAANGEADPAPAAIANVDSSDSSAGGGGVLDQASIEKLIAGMGTEAPTPAAPAPAAPAPAPAASVAPAPAMDAGSAALLQQMMDMMKQQMEFQRQEIEHLKNMHQQAAAPKQIKVSGMPQPNLNDGSGAVDPDANLDLIMGVPLEVSVEIGRTKKLVKDIIEFNKGSLIVLNKLAGEQVDVFVNGQCIAKGDVVVVDDNFGVRITEILQEELNVIEE